MSNQSNTGETGGIKSIQKLTGKLAQEMRDGESILTSKDIKYVLNSIISAFNSQKLEGVDRDDVIGKLSADNSNGEMDITEKNNFCNC